ncbi:MAG: alpha/beta hydrolase [Halieaceae bacterium]
MINNIFKRFAPRHWVLALLIYGVGSGSAIADSETGSGLPSTGTVDFGVSFDDVLALPQPQASGSISYGSDELQTLAYYPADGGSRAEILLIHGGCWSNAYSRDHLLPLAWALAEAGYSTWLPEYRRVGDAGGGWPGSLEDVAAALARVADQTDGPLLLVGHSAGGHLALLASQEVNPFVAGVLALAPITDLGAYGAQEGSCQAMVSEFLGGSLEEYPLVYREAAVIPERVSVPARLLLGTEDPIVGVDQLAGFRPEQMQLLTGAGHFDLIHPGTAAFPILLETLATLIPKREPL